MNEEIAPDLLVPYLRAEYALEEPLACSLIRRGFNDTYLVESGAGKFVFRVYFRDKYYIGAVDNFRWELDLLANLHNGGVPVCPAIARKNGDILGAFDDAGGPRSCALFPFVDGEPPEKADEARAAQMGDIAGRLHQAADSFQTQYPRYHFDLKYLSVEPLRLIDEFLREQGRAGVDKYKQVVTEQEAIISAIGRAGPVYGPIHGDLHRGNILASGDTMTLIDFDHGGYGWRAYDLATCTGGMPEPALQAFLEAYEKIRPLESAEKSALPAFRKVRPLWDTGDVLAMRKAWDNYDEFGSEFADKTEQMLARCFGGDEPA